MSLGEMVGLPTSEQINEQNRILNLIADRMDRQGKEFEIASFDYVADIIQMNRAREFLSAGDAFLVNHDVFNPQYWRTLGINSGDIYSPTYTGDILVETPKFVAASGLRNDFDLRYKRYKNSTELTTPLDGDVTEVRMIETSGTNYSYNSSRGALTFGAALPKNTIAYVVGKINNVEYRTTIFGDGTTTSFDIEITVEGVASALDVITQITYVTDEWEYDAATGTIHIGASGNELPFGDSVEVDERTTKPSITLHTVDCLNTTFQFNRVSVNFYHTSNIRQFMNAYGKKGTWFQKMSSTDTAPDWATTQDGFLEGLDRGLLKHVKKCRKITALPYDMQSVYDGATSITTTEKFFLLSLFEANAGLNNGVAEGNIYEYYNQFSGADLNAARIKKVGTANKEWWLRSPVVGTTNRVLHITSSGGLHNEHQGTNWYGLAPACIIG